MKYNVYCIHDKKSTWMSPTIDVNDETASRNFEYAIRHADGLMAFKPYDFALYQIGTFDNQNGKIEPLDVPDLIIDGSSFEVLKNE